MPIPHPEFAECLPGKIADSFLRVLRADGACAGYFTSIESYEIDDFALAVKTIKAPAAAVVLNEFQESRWGGNRQGRLEVNIELMLVLPFSEPDDTKAYLSARIVQHVKALLEVAKGQLFDESVPDPLPITDSLLAVQRIRQPARSPNAAAVIKRANFIFEATTNIETGVFL